MIKSAPPYVQPLLQDAINQVEQDGVIATDTGLRLVALGYDLDALTRTITQSLEDTQ